MEDKLRKKLELAEMKKNLWTCYRVGKNLIKPTGRKTRPNILTEVIEKKIGEERLLRMEEKKEERRACVLLDQLEDWE